VTVLAMTVLAFAALAVGVGFTVAEPPDALERKVADAERHLYYRITHASGPTFELTGEETSVRFVVLALVPGTYDPARELEVGVRVELAGYGWKRDLFARARQSKARAVPDHGGMWLDENTFSLHRGLEFTDDRAFTVPLPAIAAGAILKVTLLGDAAEGIVRASTRVERTSVARRLEALRPADREHAASQLGFSPWDHVEASNELAMLRFVERKLSAEGEEGEDYEIREVYTTGFRTRESAEAARGIAIAPGRDAAVNVIGPASIELGIEREDVLDATAATVTVAMLGEGAAVSPIDIAMPARDGRTKRRLDVPAGVYTLTLSATRGARIDLDGPSQAVLAARPGSPLAPDVQRIATYVVGPSSEPVRVALAGPDDAYGRVVRVDVPALAATEVTLSLDAIDANGTSLATTTTKIESELSRFEVAQLYGKLEASVSEPIVVRLVAPRGARELRIRTDAPALVAMSAPIGAATPDVLDAPYADVVLPVLLWRYARFASRGWIPIRAANHASLVPERLAAVAAQARLETRVAPPTPEQVGTSLAPAEKLERQTVVERVAADAIATWSRANYTRLVPGKPIALDFSRSPDRANITYAVDDDAIGATLTVELDGRTVEDHVMSSTGGKIDLPRGTTGTHTLLVKTSAKARVLLDRPPAKGSSGELIALRTVYRVSDDGKAFRVKVTKHGTAPENVNFVFYTPRAVDTAQVRLVVDNAAPHRAEGVALAKWTIADRTLVLPPADHPATLGFTDVGRGGPLYPHLVAIALGDDLAPGTHEITVRVAASRARPIWGRFFVLDGGTSAPRAVQWRDTDDLSAGDGE
jgi:hypothetical protein